MTPHQRRRQDLVTISGSLEGHYDFKENDGDFLWALDGGDARRKGQLAPTPIPIQLHYCPLERATATTGHGEGQPVLLLHGASAGADTFLVPNLRGGDCFVDALLREGFEPWLLDWRASKEVAETIKWLCSDQEDVEGDRIGRSDLSSIPDRIKEQFQSRKEEIFQRLNFNSAAEHDIKRALEAISALRPGRDIGVVAHCMGGAIMAEALVRGVLDHESLSHIVLSTMGVFYEMNLHGRMKADAHLIKRLRNDRDEREQTRRFIDPRPVEDAVDPHAPLRDPWPEDIEALYEAWRIPYDEPRLRGEGIPKAERPVFELFNRLSFMFGEPYQEGNLAPEIHHRLQALTIERHGDRNVGEAPLGSLIEVDGAPMGEVAYDWNGVSEPLWVGRCETGFKVGQVIFADGHKVGAISGIATDVEGRNGPLLPGLFGAMSLDLFQHGAENLRAHIATAPKEDRPAGDAQSIISNVENGQTHRDFERLDAVTLIGGGLNRLWHRDSIDRMADWLRRSPKMRDKLRKKIFLNYGHQDLFWGRRSSRDVFPYIIEGLGPRAPDPDDEPPHEVDGALKKRPVQAV